MGQPQNSNRINDIEKNSEDSPTEESNYQLLEAKKEKKPTNLLEDVDTLPKRLAVITRISIPTALTGLIARSVSISNLMFLGHQDNDALLAGYGLVGSVLSMMGMTIVGGLISALDTLISQAAGAGKIKQCGVYLNQARFIMTILWIPVAILSLNIEQIMLYMGQNDRVAFFAQQYVYASLPGNYMGYLNQCQVHFLNNLGKTKVPLMATIISSILHPIWLYFLMGHSQLNLGITGLAIANTATNLVVLVFNMTYTYSIKEIRESVFLPDRRIFYGMKKYFELGIPNAINGALDGLAHNIFKILAGYLGTGELSGLTIMMDIMVTMWVFGKGLNQAACTFVGQALGAGRVDLARQFYHNFCQIGTVMIIIIMILFYHFKEEFVCLYTDNESLRSQVLKAIPIMLFNIFPDMFKGMLGGIIKALGIQRKSVYVHLVCHWCIFMTLIYIFAFRWNLGLTGMFLAKTCMEWCIAIGYASIIHFTNWDQVVTDLKVRHEESKSKSSDNFELMPQKQ